MLEELAPAVQLCVAHAGPNQEQHQANVRAIEEWCNENAVELVLWDPHDEGTGVGEASTGGMPYTRPARIVNGNSHPCCGPQAC